VIWCSFPKLVLVVELLIIMLHSFDLLKNVTVLVTVKIDFR